MINILQQVSLQPKRGEDEWSFYLRFNDLPVNKQQHLIGVLKEDSSIYTLRKKDGITTEEATSILQATNPVIFDFSKTRAWGYPLYRWKEKQLSQLIYHYWRGAFKHWKVNRKSIEYFNDRLIFLN